MALNYIDRALETSTTTGTGSYALAGAVVGHQTLAAVGNANTCFYSAWEVDASGIPSGGWEVGVGTWSTGGTLARTTILKSSNANAAVSWAAGTRRVAVVIPADALEVFCSVTNSAAQSIPNAGASYTPITFDSEASDSKGMHSTVTNTSRVTIVIPGTYTVAGSLRYAPTAGGIRETLLRLNGTTVFGDTGSDGSANFDLVNVSGMVQCVAGDYIEMCGYQTSGAAINSQAAGGQPSLQVARVA